MRYDLGKCVIERPRRGSSNPSVKARWFGKITCDEDGYDYDGMMRLPASRKQEGYHKKIGDKGFTDVLGPIEGYLRSSVGRAWNDVYSELCAGLSRSSWPMRHVLTFHVNVAVNTWQGVDNKIWYNGERGPHIVDGSYGSEFYVHPRSQTLEWHRDRPRYKYRRNKEGESVKLTDGRCMVKIDGLWFIGRYKDRELPHGRFCSGCEICRWPHSAEREFVKEKSASRMEIRRALS